MEVDRIPRMGGVPRESTAVWPDRQHRKRPFRDQLTDTEDESASEPETTAEPDPGEQLPRNDSAADQEAPAADVENSEPEDDGSTFRALA